VSSDLAASRWVSLHLAAGAPLEPLGLRGGDMAHTMGGGAPGRFDGPVVRAPVDLLRVVADGDEHWALAHVVARRGWWRGEVVLAMNAQFLGRYDVAPRGHPNDGRVDVIHVDPSMRARARWHARRRARIGTHLPHPQIAVRSTDAWRTEFDHPVGLWIDGERRGDVRVLEVTVVPDALIVLA
jgi:hypothetical protein